MPTTPMLVNKTSEYQIQFKQNRYSTATIYSWDLLHIVAGWHVHVQDKREHTWYPSCGRDKCKHFLSLSILKWSRSLATILEYYTDPYIGNAIAVGSLVRQAVRISSTIALTYSISQEICTRFCCALLCCGYAIVHNEFTWSIYPYSSGLLCWHWGNR